jgi:hypothetical protein
MQWCTSSALRALGALVCALLYSESTLAEAAETSCPPEEQAVLAAYQQCRAFYLQGSLADQADVLEAHADRLRGACSTDKSEVIDADPFQDLLDCAQAMAEAGQVTQARTIEPVAQAYRAGQMLRLMMHGGQVLDPARYIGRPSDYEHKRAKLGPAEERITTPELSAGKPKGGGWKLLTDKARMPVVYWKEPAWMSIRPVKGQNLIVVLTTRNPSFARSIDAEQFPAALEKLLGRSAGKQSRIVSISATHAREPAAYCADYVMIEEESDNPELPGVVLETSTWGFACLERSSKLVVQAYFSESKPSGTPTVLDDVVRGEAEAFLRDISFEPKR